MKLYFSPGVCSLASHIVLRELGLPHEIAYVDLKTHKLADGSDYYGINSKGYVPALRLDDGTLLTEGAAILQYLGDLKPSAGLIPPAGTLARYQLVEWLTFVSSELHKNFSALFRADVDAASKQSFRNTLDKRLAFLDRELGGKQYLTGDHFTVADAYAYTILSWKDSVGLDISKWPNVAAYLQRVAKRPSVRETLHQEKLAA